MRGSAGWVLRSTTGGSSRGPGQGSALGTAAPAWASTIYKDGSFAGRPRCHRLLPPRWPPKKVHVADAKAR